MNEATREHLNRFAKSVVRSSRQNLTKKGKNDTKGLYESIKYDLNTHKRSFSLTFEMEEYGQYIDKGVKGAKESSLAPNSPFRFGTGSSKGGKSLSSIMADYAKRKGFQWKDKKTGRFMSHKSMGYIMARSKYNKGIAPSMFFTRPFETAFKQLPDELVRSFALDIEKLLNHTLNNKDKK